MAGPFNTGTGAFSAASGQPSNTTNPTFNPPVSGQAQSPWGQSAPPWGQSQSSGGQSPPPWGQGQSPWGQLGGQAQSPWGAPNQAPMPPQPQSSGPGQGRPMQLYQYMQANNNQLPPFLQQYIQSHPNLRLPNWIQALQNGQTPPWLQQSAAGTNPQAGFTGPLPAQQAPGANPYYQLPTSPVSGGIPSGDLMTVNSPQYRQPNIFDPPVTQQQQATNGNVTSGGIPTGDLMTVNSPQYRQPSTGSPPTTGTQYGTTMSTGVAPWAYSLNNNTVLPQFQGQPSIPLASAQQWQGYNPQEQQAILQSAQMMGIPAQAYQQMMQAAAPEWGNQGQGQYTAY